MHCNITYLMSICDLSLLLTLVFLFIAWLWLHPNENRIFIRMPHPSIQDLPLHYLIIFLLKDVHCVGKESELNLSQTESEACEARVRDGEKETSIIFAISHYFQFIAFLHRNYFTIRTHKNFLCSSETLIYIQI